MLSVEGVFLKTFLEIACKAIGSVPDALKRETLGRPRYHTKSRLAALLVKAWLNKSHRGVEVYIEDSKQILAEFGLTVPDHNTIWRTMTFLPEAYLKELNTQVAANLKRGTRHSRRRNCLRRSKLHLLGNAATWKFEGV